MEVVGNAHAINVAIKTAKVLNSFINEFSLSMYSNEVVSNTGQIADISGSVSFDMKCRWSLSTRTGLNLLRNLGDIGGNSPETVRFRSGTHLGSE